jgi:hypothetical protein
VVITGQAADMVAIILDHIRAIMENRRHKKDIRGNERGGMYLRGAKFTLCRQLG